MKMRGDTEFMQSLTGIEGTQQDGTSIFKKHAWPVKPKFEPKEEESTKEMKVMDYNMEVGEYMEDMKMYNTYILKCEDTRPRLFF